MGQVSVTLNGRTYRLHCGDGEEQRVRQLGQDLADRMQQLAGEFGSSAHDRLLVMAALMISDELVELRDKVRQIREAPAGSRESRRADRAAAEPVEEPPSQARKESA